jgi:hypothetical protein
MKKIYLHGESIRDHKELDVEANATHALLLDLFKREFQIPENAGDYTIFIQEDEILSDGTEILLEAEIIHRGHYHFHRCKVIRTAVTYNGTIKNFEFKPSATCSHVLYEVTAKFKITPNDAAKLILKVDDETILKATDYIGSFAGHHDCALSLSLASKKVIEG